MVLKIKPFQMMTKCFKILRTFCIKGTSLVASENSVSGSNKQVLFYKVLLLRSQWTRRFFHQPAKTEIAAK